MERGRVVLIAAGIGITPFASMLAARLDDGADLTGLVLVHVLRASDRAVYEDLLARAEEAGALVHREVAPEAVHGLAPEQVARFVGSEGSPPSNYFLSGAPGFVSRTAASVRRVDPTARWRPWRVRTDSFSGY